MSFPNFEEPLKRLVKDHRSIKDQPLLLAIYFAPNRKEKDVYLFEVADRFRGNAVSDKKKMLEIGYAATPGFPMDTDQRLHLILTNPEEMKAAIKGNWKDIKKLRKSKLENTFKVLHKSRRIDGILEQI